MKQWTEYKVKVYDDGAVYWFKQGTEILHRENGPAVIWANGNK